MKVLQEKAPYKRTWYQGVLLAGGLFGCAAPAVAQPTNLLAALNGRPAVATFSSQRPSLAEAHDEVEGHRWFLAEDSLERFETSLLNDGDRSSTGVFTSPSQALPYVIQARVAVKQHKQLDALVAIDKAIAAVGVSAPLAPAPSFAQSSATLQVLNSSARGLSVSSSVPMVTKALLPGHWRLTGWQYHWVLPDTQYRPVQSNPYIIGHYEYRVGQWDWVPGHYQAATN